MGSETESENYQNHDESSQYHSSDAERATEPKYPHKLFQNHKVYHVNPDNDNQLEYLNSLADNPEIDRWTSKRRLSEPTDVMVSPKYQPSFEEKLNQIKMDFDVIIDNVESIINTEKINLDKLPDKIRGVINFRKYHRYCEIQNYLSDLASEYPSLVSLENYGISYENRSLTLIHISTKKGDEKPTIFIDAGIHAREWIAPAQALYIIHQLVEIQNNRDMIENVNWIVVPLVNPDGYEYSQTTHRLWRKTRSKPSGVDANRNFDFHWMGPGSSNDERSSTYAGPYPFSENETFYLSEVLKKYAGHIKLYLTLHSAAQCILYPWGFTTQPPENVGALNELAEQVADTIFAVNQSVYDVGSSIDILASTSGSSRDWVKGVLGVDLCYTIELPGGGRSGFDLPPHEILNVVQEIFIGIKVFQRYIQEKYTT